MLPDLPVAHINEDGSFSPGRMKPDGLVVVLNRDRFDCSDEALRVARNELETPATPLEIAFGVCAAVFLASLIVFLFMK